MNWQDLIGKITCEDCMDILTQLPDKCVDLVLTDPPYGGGGKDKAFADGDNRFGGRFDKYKAQEIKCARTGGNWNHKYEDVQKITDLDYAPSQEVFDEIFRVSKNQIIWGATILICHQQDALMCGKS